MEIKNSATGIGSAPRPMPKKSSLRIFAVMLLAGWTAVIGTSLRYNISLLQSHALDSARIQALTAFEKDVIYRDAGIPSAAGSTRPCGPAH